MKKITREVWVCENPDGEPIEFTSELAAKRHEYIAKYIFAMTESDLRLNAAQIKIAATWMYDNASTIAEIQES